MLSRGTVGIVCDLVITVCALSRFGLACRWISDGREAALANAAALACTCEEVDAPGEPDGCPPPLPLRGCAGESPE